MARFQRAGGHSPTERVIKAPASNGVAGRRCRWTHASLRLPWPSLAEGGHHLKPASAPVASGAHAERGHSLRFEVRSDRTRRSAAGNRVAWDSYTAFNPLALP